MKSTSQDSLTRQRARETLQSLEPFLRSLSDQCLKAADEIEEGMVFSPAFDRVLENLLTLNQLLMTWGSVFALGNSTEFQTLKAEMLSLVQDLEQFSGESGKAHRVSLLRGELPGYADELRMRGIPLLLKLIQLQKV